VLIKPKCELSVSFWGYFESVYTMLEVASCDGECMVCHLSLVVL
jgi:hypothetical protein